MKWRIVLLCCLASTRLWAAEPDARWLKLRLGSGQTLVAAEGEGEPRSIGSYSIRLYEAAPAPNDTAFFQYGLVSPRDGTLKAVKLIRLDADSPPLVVVIMESAGSGGYLSADAYLAAPDNLTMLRCVRGLPPKADLAAALKKAQGADVSCAP